MLNYIRTRLEASTTEVTVPEEYHDKAVGLIEALSGDEPDFPSIFNGNSYFMRNASIVDAAVRFMRGRGTGGENVKRLRDKLYLNVTIEGNLKCWNAARTADEWDKAVLSDQQLTDALGELNVNADYKPARAEKPAEIPMAEIPAETGNVRHEATIPKALGSAKRGTGNIWEELERFSGW